MFCLCGCGEKTPLASKTRTNLGYVKGQPVPYIRGHKNRGLRGPSLPKPPSPNPTGMCLCGCGRTTDRAAYTSHRDGTVYGEPLRYIKGHNGRKNVWFNNSDGRWYVYCRDGSRDAWARVVLTNEIGRPLSSTENAHHVNGDRADDRPENLELLEVGEHLRTHIRERGYIDNQSGRWPLKDFPR